MRRLDLPLLPLGQNALAAARERVRRQGGATIGRTRYSRNGRPQNQDMVRSAWHWGFCRACNQFAPSGCNHNHARWSSPSQRTRRDQSRIPSSVAGSRRIAAPVVQRWLRKHLSVAVYLSYGREIWSRQKRRFEYVPRVPEGGWLRAGWRMGLRAMHRGVRPWSRSSGRS